MNAFDSINLLSLCGDSTSLPSSFAESVQIVKTFALREFDQQIAQKQLYYHNRNHINAVQQRSRLIFDVVSPYLYLDEVSLTRLKLLLKLCVTTHDMIQVFLPQSEIHSSRKREAGVSEQATISWLMAFIHALNSAIEEQDPHSSALFGEAELAVIRSAIAATICQFDPIDQAIYQPDLYDSAKTPSSITRILALADIGSLGIEGIKAFNQEGSVLFLEENPDVIEVLRDRAAQSLVQADAALAKNICQRLLRRAQFQVRFARSRFKRYFDEVKGFPTAAIPVLTNEVFPYLTLETIREIELTTPTQADTSLDELVNFFQLEEYLYA